MSILGQSFHETGGEKFSITKVEHSSNSTTFEIDQSADPNTVAVLKRGSGGTAPTVSVDADGSETNNGLKTVTLTGGSTGTLEILARHRGTIGSAKPRFASEW